MSIPNLPGISPATVQAAGLRHVTPHEAEALCGMTAAGIWIPYFTVSGKRVRRPSDSVQGYGRLRLDHPTPEGQRYTQRKLTKPYGYVLPVLLAPLTLQTDLVVVEGEKKALALLDAGVSAIGVGGLTLAIYDNQLVPGLQEWLQNVPTIRRILWLGDGDTSLIFAFSREAVKLARLLAAADIKLACPRIGLAGPDKGIDDVRAKIGADAFPDYWNQLVEDAESVNPDDSAEALAVRLLKREDADKLREVARG